MAAMYVATSNHCTIVLIFVPLQALPALQALQAVPVARALRATHPRHNPCSQKQQYPPLLLHQVPSKQWR